MTVSRSGGPTVAAGYPARMPSPVRSPLARAGAALLVVAGLLPQRGCAQDAAAPSAMPFPDCVSALRRQLGAHPEVSEKSFDTFTRDAKDLRPRIAEATSAQPEFQLPIWDYLARRADAQRVADGKALLARESAAVAQIERPGVDAATSVAVFGVESDYGHGVDRTPVVDATLSRACLNLASRERQDHFFAALWLLQEGVVAPEEFRGSWAGAFGMTQFMPGTFVHYLRDRPEDPPADILHSVPDALATTARFLRGMGWTTGQRWGVEAKAPPAAAALAASESDHACLLAAPAADDKCRSVAQWSRMGVTRVDGTPLAGGRDAGLAPDARAALLMPAGPAGPAWLVTGNYQAIWRYNRADAYALAIGLLSDALRGDPPQRTPWPTDDPGLSRAEFRELQAQLRARGACEVAVDGAEGPITRAAIRAQEDARHWPATGHAGGKLLAALRAERGEPVDCAARAVAAPEAASAASQAAPPASAVPLPPVEPASAASGASAPSA